MGQEDSTALTGIAHLISISTFSQLLGCARHHFEYCSPTIFITQLAHSCFLFSFVVEALSAKVMYRTGRAVACPAATGTPHCGRRPECDCR